MGIDLHIEDEHGKSIYCISDDQQIFAHVINQTKMSEYSLLKYIDPYGDTTFNNMQLNDLLYDLSSLHTTISDIATRKYVNKLISLLENYTNTNHVYFKFYGD